MIYMVEDMTVGEAIRRIKEFALHHAVQELPNSARTVEAFGMAITALEVVSKIVTCGECKKWNKYKDGIKGLCGHSDHVMPTREDFFCADGERKQEQ